MGIESLNITGLLVLTGVALFVILIILLIALAFKPGRKEDDLPRAERDDLKKIRDEIEHEVEDEAMHEIEPLKKPNRGRPKSYG